MNLRLKICDLRFGNLIFCCLFIACLASTAYAHKVSIYAYAEDGMVYSEGYFVDGTKCKNSLVEVLDEKTGTKLLEGKTDEEGRFSFKIPKATPLKLILNASMGHRAEYTLSEDEVRDAMGVKDKKQASSAKQPTESANKTAQSKNSETYAIQSVDVEAALEKAIDKKLQPMMKMLIELKEKSEGPGPTEVIGGIGYIVGIFGIIAYLKAKRKG